MDTTLKALIGSVIAAVVALLIYVAAQFGFTPSPLPSPSPSPTATATLQFASSVQKPFPGIVQTWNASTSLKGSRGEVVTALIKSSVCTPLAPSSDTTASVSYFTLNTFTTSKPSYIGAPLGTQYDALTPATQICPSDLVWVDVAISSSATAGAHTVAVANVSVPLTVWKMTMPIHPTHPIYMEIVGAALLAGHKLDPNSNVSVQAALTQKYIDMARAHRIEPYKQRITDLSVNADGTPSLDQWNTYGGSFRQLVFTNNIAPGMIDPMIASALLTPSLLTAFNQIPAQYSGAWAYVMDEPNTAALLSEATSRAKLFKQYAPNVRTMVTIEYSSALAPYVDVFCPHDLFFNQPNHVAASAYTKPFWLYGSCMNHGSCADGALAAPGTLPGPPDLLIDLPMVHARAYTWVNATLGAKASLYYAMVESYLHYGVFHDAWVDQYVFSGNGDGTLFYPDRTYNLPIASLRLKAIRQSSFDLEYVNLALSAGVVFKNPVVDALNWSKSYDDYEAARISIGTALNSLP